MKHTTLRFLGLLLVGLVLGTASARADDFSGKTSVVTDTFNGYKIAIPEEFKAGTKGATSDWEAAPIDGGAPTISINVVEMKGVPSKILYDTNFKRYKEDRNYTEVVPVTTVKLNGKSVLAFRCKEADHKAGSNDPKADDEIHRWHLFVFGNDRDFTCGFTGMVASFKAKKLQGIFEKSIASMQLISVK